MADIYVTTSGNDSSGNGSVGSPYLTISKAFAAASNYDVIIVNDSGTYTVVEGGANQVISATGVLKTALTFKAGENCNPIFDGGGSATYALKTYNSWTIQGLTFRNFVDATAGTGTGVIRQVTNHRVGFVYDCVFHNITGAAVNVQKAGTKVERNKIYDLDGHAAIYVGIAVGNEVNNNIIYNTSARAIFASQGTIEHNTIYNSPRELDAHGTTAYRNYTIQGKYIRYNIVEKTNVIIAGVRAISGETRYNCVTGAYSTTHSPNNYYNNSPGTGDIQTSPEFTDKNNADFTFPTSSPCFQGAHTSSMGQDQQRFDRTWQYDDKIFGHNTAGPHEMGALEKHPSRIMGVNTSDIAKVLGNAG